MPIKVEVKSNNHALKAERSATADRVIKEFGERLPDSSLLCFLDDEDWRELKDEHGQSNRGFYTPLNNFTLNGNGDWMPYLRERIFAWDEGSMREKRVFDHLIYLHGSTCACDPGLVMTFAHELQHFTQYSTQHDVWAANRLIPDLPKTAITALGSKWADVPCERDARIVSKRVAEKLCDVRNVKEYIDQKIREAEAKCDWSDRGDWEFIRDLDPSAPYDLAQATGFIFPRLKQCRSSFEDTLNRWKSDPDSECIDLDLLLDGGQECR